MAREPDVRPVAPAWRDLEGLVEGARRRGFTDAQVDYLRSVVGVTWAKAYHAGELSRRRLTR